MCRRNRAHTIDGFVQNNCPGPSDDRETNFFRKNTNLQRPNRFESIWNPSRIPDPVQTDIFVLHNSKRTRFIMISPGFCSQFNRYFPLKTRQPRGPKNYFIFSRCQQRVFTTRIAKTIIYVERRQLDNPRAFTCLESDINIDTVYWLGQDLERPLNSSAHKSLGVGFFFN